MRLQCNFLLSVTALSWFPCRLSLYLMAYLGRVESAVWRFVVIWRSPDAVFMFHRGSREPCQLDFTHLHLTSVTKYFFFMFQKLVQIIIDFCFLYIVNIKSSWSIQFILQCGLHVKLNHLYKYSRLCFKNESIRNPVSSHLKSVTRFNK